MIGEDDTARLADFGFRCFIADPSIEVPDTETFYLPKGVCYMAPELLNPSQFHLPNSSPVKESDVYSFAMTAYEVCSFRTVRDRRSSLTLH